MKILGEIENVSYNGLWIIRTEMKPKIGSNVYNQQKKLVGRIINIIGPVSRPYLLVRPKSTDKHQQLQLIGEKMYIMQESKSKKRKQLR